MVHVAIIPITADIAANTDIDLPEPYPDISDLVSAIKFSKVDISHAACGATGAAYASATVLGSPINGATLLTVVSGTPESGQIAKTGDRKVQLGDAAKEGEFLLIVYIARGEIIGF